MKKVLVLFTLIFGLLYAETAREELVSKIQYALNCNAKFSNVAEVEISVLKPSKKYQGSYYVSGIYKSVLSISGNKGGFSIGDEFHPQSGTFKGIVDKNLELKKVKWKVGMLKGYIKSTCLQDNEDDL